MTVHLPLLTTQRLRRMRHGYRVLGAVVLIAAVVIAVLPVPDLFLLWTGWRLFRHGRLSPRAPRAR